MRNARTKEVVVGFLYAPRLSWTHVRLQQKAGPVAVGVLISQAVLLCPISTLQDFLVRVNGRNELTIRFRPTVISREFISQLSQGEEGLKVTESTF